MEVKYWVKLLLLNDLQEIFLDKAKNFNYFLEAALDEKMREHFLSAKPTRQH